MNVAGEIIREARSLLPGAARQKNARDKKNRGKQILECQMENNALRLHLRGPVDPMDLVEDLSRSVHAAARARSLELDVSQATLFDQLALSAVLVVLRNHADGFCSVSLRGLAPWAKLRIHQTGAENIMGPGWRLLPNGQCLELRLKTNPGGLIPAGA